MINYNQDYGLPLNWFLFEDNYGYSLPMNKELKTTEQAQNYFNKLVETLGSDYKLNYYFVEPNDDLSDISFTSNVDIEKIVRIIAINDKKKYKDDKLKFGTTYKLTFKYTHFIGTDAKEETIDTYSVTTLTPNVSMTGTKVTNKKIDYKIDSQHKIESAKLRLYINNEKQSTEISINNDNLTGSFSIVGVVIPINAVVELRLEDIYISGAKINRNVSWSYRATSTQLPDIPKPPTEPENPEIPEEPTEPENPDNPEEPVVPDNPEEPDDEGTDVNNE